MKTGIIALAIFVLIIVTIFAVKPRPNNLETSADLEVFLDKMVKGNNPPGVSVAVVEDGKIVYQYATGLADGPKNIPATNDTVYHWWSLTKVVTAVGVLQLAEKGMLDLDTPVTEYLPFFEVDYGNFAGPITTRQLLRHSAGIPDTIPDIFSWLHYEDEIYDQTDQVKQYMPEYNRLKFEPDSKSAYTNYGYMMLGAVIEQVSGMTYEEYVVDEILKPAGIENSGFLYTPEMGKNEAVGSHPLVHVMTPLMAILTDFDALVRERTGLTCWFERVYIDVLPSTGMIGPADDAARLLIALQTPGVLLSAETLAGMLPLGEAPDERPLGWAEYSLERPHWVQHRGGGPGFATQMRYYPGENLGIILMANGTNLDQNGLADAVAEIFIH